MKVKIFAVGILITVVGFTIFDTVFLQRQLSQLRESAAGLDVSDKNPNAEEDAKALSREFMKKERFISLSVNHEDLTNIEEAFTELIAELSVSEHNDAEVAKNRLVDAFEHLRRLSGCNIDSVI